MPYLASSPTAPGPSISQQELPSEQSHALAGTSEELSSALSLQDDDAIARHHQYFPLSCGQGTVRYASTVPFRTRTRSRSRSRSSSDLPYAHSVPSFRVGVNGSHSFNQDDEPYEIQDDYGTSAFAEEEAALEHAAELAAAKARSKLTKLAGAQLLGATLGSGTASNPGSLLVNSITQDPAAVYDEEEEQIEDEESDHFLSGLCLPRSQFFKTSIICSNTMTRDGLANERTFLAWLNACNALCLVSFTFISRAFTLDAVNTLDGQADGHKDKLSRAIGYVCFLSAFVACIYSLLKYLRNIRRISTRYPFAQAGAWTFTVGMFLGILIMVALVLAYTTNL